MTSLTAARVLTSAGWLDTAEVNFVEDRIERVGRVERSTDVEYLAPGFVDIQVNGFAGVDLATSPYEEWPQLAAALAGSGVTSWLPTLVSRPLHAYADWLERVAAFARAGHGPRVLGAHLEGPWLGRLAGAHTDIPVGPIDLEWCRSLPATVRIVTLCPERPGVADAVKCLTDSGIVVAAGHSNADHATARKAFDAGVSLLTHCFNATTPIHHRDPGLTAAALARDDVYISLIADGHHIHPDILKVAVRAKGPERTVLVSDSSGWMAGTLGATTIRLVDGAPRTPDGGLAGSALTLDAAVRYMVDQCGQPLDDTLRSASTVPARLIGESDVGVIEPGAKADLVALDDNLEVRAVWINGEQVA